MLIIPWMLAWDIALEGFLMYVAWFTAVFWTLDIALSFVTAINKNGELISEPCEIIRSYVRGWFVLDCIICTCDWASIVILSSPSWRSLRFARATRLLRLTSLARLAKIFQIVSQLLDEFLPDEMLTTTQFMRCFLNTLVIAHFASCLWWLIGRAGPTDTGWNWIQQSPMDGELTFAEESTSYQYAVCLHWAVSSITLGGYVPAEPHNTVERLYSALILALGLLFGGALISILSTTMLETQMTKRESNSKLKKLRRYMREHKVERTLSVRVYGQLAERLATRDKLKEEQVTGLQLLSSNLRSELCYHLHRPLLKNHDLLKLWMDIDEPLTQRLCKKCMAFVHLRKQDDLFCAGRRSDSAYVFTGGLLRYIQEPETSPLTAPVFQEVDTNGKWISEATMWSHWTHVGTMNALVNSEVMQVKVAEMWDFIMQRTAPCVEITKDYCKKFHRRLQVAKPPVAKWPDDLKVPGTGWADVVLAMELQSQVVIGLGAIDQDTNAKRKNSAASLDRLRSEVRLGKSAVMVSGDSELERVVSITAINLENHEGKFLVQLAKLQDGVLKPYCNLPGGKQLRGELVLESLERFLETFLAPLAPLQLQVVDMEQTSRWQESRDLGIQTKYLRNVIRVKMGRPFEDAENIVALELDPDFVELGGGARDSPQSAKDGNVKFSLDGSNEIWGVGDGGMLSGFVRQMSGYSRGDVRQTSHSPMKSGAVFGKAQVALKNRTVYHMGATRNDGGLFAWFTELEYNTLKSAIGAEVVPGWLSSLKHRLDSLPAPPTPPSVPQSPMPSQALGNDAVAGA
jgi:hypothetical protein